MKTRRRSLLAPLSCLALAFAGRLVAQTSQILYNFGPAGHGPQSELLLSSNILFGTTAFGGNWGNGTVFSVRADDTNYTLLHTFTAVSGSNETNNDGAEPFAGLVLSGRTLYGTTRNGGSLGGGTVFKIDIGGTGFTPLHSFPNNNGPVQGFTGPVSRLVLSGSTLFGTTAGGGDSEIGSIFAVSTSGTGFTNLYSFSGNTPDGGNPQAGLILSGSTLYGTASGDNAAGSGTVFAINTDGTGFRILHEFNGTTDGAAPLAELILSGQTLYGTTEEGGTAGVGTVFAVCINGTGFTNLHNFILDTNGVEPLAGLALSGNTLYGTTEHSGTSGTGPGTVFGIGTDGTGFTTLYTFTGPPTDGAFPDAGLVLGNNALYGTTFEGGSFYSGTIFSVTFPIPTQLGLMSFGGNVILTWPTNNVGFTLQSTTNLASSSWVNVTPGPVTISGQNTVTNQATGSQRYYRLTK